MSRRLAGATCAVVVLVVLAGCADAPDRVRGRQQARADGATTTVATPATPATVEASACGTPAVPLLAGEHTLTSSGIERSYLLALPEPFDDATPAPVLLNFHGSGSDMAQQAVYSGFPDVATERGYIVVTPQGTGTPRGWDLSGGADDIFVADLLSAVEAGACVDEARIYASGISNGSAFSALMGCRTPYRIAAVGMVAATVPEVCPIDRPIPAIAFHGTDDRVVPYTGGDVNSRGSDGTQAPGAEGAIAQWAERNSCTEGPTDTRVAPDVLSRTWSGCTDGADVAFYRIEGGGHTWPGGLDVSKIGLTHLGATTTSISATTAILDFFDSHPMPAERLATMKSGR